MYAVVGVRKHGVGSQFGVTLYNNSGKVLFSDTYKSSEEKKSAKRTLLSLQWAFKRLCTVIGTEEVPCEEGETLTIYLNKTVYLWLSSERVGVHQDILEKVLYELSFLPIKSNLATETKETKYRYIVRFKKEGLKAFKQKYVKARELFQ